MVTRCVRSRWLSALRKPNALRAASLIARLMPSLLALLSPVSMNASTSGYRRSAVTASCLTSGMSEPAHQVRNFPWA